MQAMTSDRADLFVWDRQAPPDWQAELDRHFPRGDLVSWLVLAWVPGTPAEPIQRWCIYEAIPPRGLESWVRTELELLDRSIVRRGAVLDRASIAAFEAECIAPMRIDEVPRERLRVLRYWQETGALLQPFWIVQGPRGGHKYQFSESERKYLRLDGLPDEAPDAGALAYADYDERCLHQLLTWDALRKGYAHLKGFRAHQRTNEAKEFRRHLVHWLGEQTEYNVRHNIADLPLDDIPVVHGAAEFPDLDEAEDRYIETGRYHL